MDATPWNRPLALSTLSRLSHARWPLDGIMIYPHSIIVLPGVKSIAGPRGTFPVAIHPPVKRSSRPYSRSPLPDLLGILARITGSLRWGPPVACDEQVT